MTLAAAWLIGAGLAQALLALLLLGWLGLQRVPLVAAGKVRTAAIALSRDGWPDRARQAANAFDNQFQLPLLLYAGIGLALWFGPTAIEAVLAWAFVLSRYAHAAIHITSNHVARRFAAFTIGYGLIALLWLDLVIRLILGAA